MKKSVKKFKRFLELKFELLKVWAISKVLAQASVLPTERLEIEDNCARRATDRASDSQNLIDAILVGF